MPRPSFALSAILICLFMPGCVMIKVGVTNPVEGLSTVAVAPFFNLSQERAVDGRRFALAYFTELQKVPGFQVIPVGVAEQQIADHGLEMDKPEDVVELARLLNVDAVVVGAVTDYDPYYPPRIGLHVEWYSARPWGFTSNIPIDPEARTRWKESHPRRWRFWERHGLFGHWHESDEDCPPEGAVGPADFRGQSPEPFRVSSQPTHSLPVRWSQPTDGPNRVAKHVDDLVSPAQLVADQQVTNPTPAIVNGPPLANPTGGITGASVGPPEFDGHKPLMSYTRIFDGSDAQLTAALRDYVELSGDQRSGGWEAYLHRSEDFIRFTAHLMIVEMLTLHGGDARRQIVFKSRKYK